MKKRIFYVINLDKNRIAILGISVFVAILGSYAFGYHSAFKTRHTYSPSVALQSDSGKLQQNEIRKQNEPRENSDYGKSIYDKNQMQFNNYHLGDVRAVKIDHIKKENTTKSSSANKKVQKRKKKKQIAKANSKKSSKKKSYQKHKTTQKKSIKKKLTNHVKKRKTALLKQDGNGIQLSNVSSRNKTHKKTITTPPKSQKNKQIKKQTHYSLQTGSFRSRRAANRMANGLTNQGFSSKVIRKNGKFNVRVGNEVDQKALWKLESKLRTKKYSPIKVKTW